MSTRISLGNITLHRIVEQENCAAFEALKFFTPFTEAQLAENRAWLQPQVHRRERPAHALHPELPGADAAPQHPGRHLRRQPQAAPDAPVLEHDEVRPATRRAWRRRASASATSISSCARICTPTTSAGTRGSRTAAGCRPSPRRATCSPTASSSTGPSARRTIPRCCPWITDSVLPIVAANRVDVVKSAHAFNDLVTLIPTPGHSIDHYSVQVGKPGADAVITGDMIHSPLQARYPETRHDGRLRLRAGRPLAPRAVRPLLRHLHAHVHGALPLAVHRPHRALARRVRLRRGLEQ